MTACVQGLSFGEQPVIRYTQMTGVLEPIEGVAGRHQGPGRVGWASASGAGTDRCLPYDPL